MTWPWISPASGTSFVYAFCGNLLSSNCSSISAYSLSFESLFLVPFTSLLLTAAERQCGFTGETPAFFFFSFPAVGISSLWFVLQTHRAANLRWQTSPIKIKAVSDTGSQHCENLTEAEDLNVDPSVFQV